MRLEGEKTVQHEVIGQAGLAELLVFTGCLVPAVEVDIRSRRIPDASLVLAAGGILALRLGSASLSVDHLVGAASAFLLLLAVWLPARGRMGFGDVKLAGLVGFLVGFPGWLFALGAASLGGVALVLARRAAGRRPRDESVAFAPFLAAAAVAVALALPFLGDA